MPDYKFDGDDRRNPDRLKVIIAETVKETLLAIGINPAHPLEAQNDMAFLRSMRERCEKVGMGAVIAGVTILVGGVLSVFVIGFKSWMGK